MELFTFQGYANTGLAQIARRAGLLPGSLYHFFPTKEDLLAATLEERLRLLRSEVLDPIWSRLDDPLERVFGLLDGYRQMLAMTEFSHGCPIGNLAIELAESHPGIRPLLAANFDNWMDAVAECFQAASARLPDEVDPRSLAVFVLTTMEGAVMLARTHRDFAAYDAAVAHLRDYVDRLVAQATGRPAPDSTTTPTGLRRPRSPR
ncbi:MAG: TetR/AcrR family transcriptional regulator [Phycisphaerales bacterium]|nr:TetR/AcrR family transcriptional regulator [Phycisphaerae bacterium]NNF43438.1 TetR/AcrR family transcriptional regulator [Phycisphaerales bacterium]NNM26593.1 TetR/AcrR family transcriptional regulator [Phycisphaerales bacterium]